LQERAAPPLHLRARQTTGKRGRISRPCTRRSEDRRKTIINSAPLKAHTESSSITYRPVQISKASSCRTQAREPCHIAQQGTEVDAPLALVTPVARTVVVSYELSTTALLAKK
jgi:hypothetical protein